MPAITLTWLHLVILLGAVQGCFLAALLATHRANQTANRLLAVAMLAFSVHLLTTVYHAARLEPRFPHFFGVGFPLPLLYGPLVCLYAVCASDRSRRLKKPDALHFLPFLSAILVTAPIYLLSGPEKLEFYDRLKHGIQPASVSFFDGLKFISGIAYSTVTLVFLRRHTARVKDSYSSLERVNLRWLYWFAGAGAAIWLLATTLEVSDVLHMPLQQDDDLVALAMAIVVYAVGYRALRQPEIFNFAVAPPAPPAVAPPAPVPEEPAADPGARYERSGLSPREAEGLRSALVAVMERDRPYQNSELTLADLATRVDTTPHKLSEVFSRQLNQTFYDFVNAYRVEDVRRRMADQRLKHLKILALALDAGFASKSTFNDVFKKHTGKTPSAYRASIPA